MLAVLVGVALVSVGLEMFLSPHKIIPGGIKGVAILLSHITEMKVGLILLFINLPFVIFKRRNMKNTIIALIVLLITTIFTVLMYPIPPLVSEPVLASLVGGVIFGCGVGLIVRFGWYVDGMNHVAFYIKKKTKLSTGEVLMIINLILLTCGGFYFGWDQAMHSIIAYYMAYKALQFTMDYRVRKMIWVTSDKREELASSLLQQFGKEITFLSPEAQTAKDRELFFTLSEKNMKQLNSIVYGLDASADIQISYASQAALSPYIRL
jgi:uncharacterized membrane-anchored protein YitT (DUF2179 family)